MDTSNKSGRTFWDLVAENKVLFSLLFLIVIGVTIWLVKTGTAVKAVGVELTPKQDTVFIKETLPALPVTEYKKADKLAPNIKKAAGDEIGNFSNNSFGDSTSITSSPVKIENHGINTGVMANSVTNVNMPPPDIHHMEWAVKNKRVDTTGLGISNLIIPSGDVKQKFIYHNKAAFSYNCLVTLDKLTLVFRVLDVIKGDVTNDGVMRDVRLFFIESPAEYKGFFHVSFAQPSNGIYWIDMYTKTPIPNISECISFVVN